jgi:mevalonate kinase
MDIHISSTIPIASGLGSGAAIAVAMIRAVSGFVGKPLPDEQVSSIAFEVEKIYHGTPSGIDNAVVTYAHPMLFQKGEPIQPFVVQGSFLFLIADTGIKSNTRVVVEDLLGRCKTWPDKYHPLFEQIGSTVLQAYTALRNGENLQVGTLMDENHSLLQQLGVSSPELDNLVQSARSAGAAGAKLSGAGWGGNMISLVDPNQEGQITLALKHAGAKHVLTTRLAVK